MILRNNLSSSPARNYSLYFIGCLLLIVAAISFTVWNIANLSSSVYETTGLQADIREQQSQRNQLKSKASQFDAQIARIKTPEFISETEFLNNAIKRRVFSWTKLFDLFEASLPENVKMVSVLPVISNEGINISMEVAGRGLNDIVELIRVLENSPVFADVTFRSERQEEQDGLLHATIALRYLPQEGEAAVVDQAIASGQETQEEEQASQEEEQTEE